MGRGGASAGRGGGGTGATGTVARAGGMETLRRTFPRLFAGGVFYNNGFNVGRMNMTNITPGRVSAQVRGAFGPRYAIGLARRVPGLEDETYSMSLRGKGGSTGRGRGTVFYTPANGRAIVEVP